MKNFQNRNCKLSIKQFHLILCAVSTPLMTEDDEVEEKAIKINQFHISGVQFNYVGHRIFRSAFFRQK